MTKFEPGDRVRLSHTFYAWQEVKSPRHRPTGTVLDITDVSQHPSETTHRIIANMINGAERLVMVQMDGQDGEQDPYDTSGFIRFYTNHELEATL